MAQWYVSYEVLKPGTGLRPVGGKTVNVHYIGHLIDGSEFLQMGPYDLVLTTNRVGPALFDGIRELARGGAIRVYVPPPLPEGEEFRLGVPPGAAIIYELEQLDFKNTPAEELAASLLPPAPEPPAPPPSGYSEAQLLEAWGWDVAQQTPAASLGLSDAETTLLLRGVAAGIKDEHFPIETPGMHQAV